MFEIFDKLMKERGLSRYRVAKDTGIAQSTLSEWKTGKTTPKLDKIEVLANYFGVTVDYLLGNEEKEKTPEPKTERELIISEIMAFVDTLSDDDLKSLHRLIVK